MLYWTWFVRRNASICPHFHDSYTDSSRCVSVRERLCSQAMNSERSLTGSLVDAIFFFFHRADKTQAPFIHARGTPIRIRTCIQKRSCPYDVAAFRACEISWEIVRIAVPWHGNYGSSRAPEQFLRQRSHRWLRRRATGSPGKGKYRVKYEGIHVNVARWQIIETPRADKWTTMSAVRRGGRKNCGGARRPEEDHREKN